MIGWTRIPITDIPKLIITMVVGAILLCVLIAPLSPDTLRRMPVWVLGGAVLLILAASIAAGNYIGEWIEDWELWDKLRLPKMNVHRRGYQLGKAMAGIGRRARSKRSN